ncbi:MAG: calcium/sodium antiporter [Candidatus Scalinduaceae bacterium]
MLIQSILFLTGILGVYFGAEWLVRGSSNLSRELGIKPIVIGLTVVAFGTSSPELAVSLTAAIRGSDEIAIGNIIGSNVANIGLVLGLSAIVFPVMVERIIMKSELPLMIVISAILYLMAIDKEIGFVDGLFLFTGIIMYISYHIYGAINSKGKEHKLTRNTNKDSPNQLKHTSPSAPLYTHTLSQSVDSNEAMNSGKVGTRKLTNKQSSTKRKNLWLNILFIAAGLAGLLIGAHLLVKAAIFIAGRFGISEMVIGLTAVAVGTSIPEMATSVVSAFRKEAEICMGNVIGSNIFNMLMVIGSVALIRPLNLMRETLFYEFPAMLLFSIALIPMIRGNLKVNRIEGFLLVLGYFIFIIFLFR